MPYFRWFKAVFHRNQLKYARKAFNLSFSHLNLLKNDRTDSPKNTKQYEISFFFVLYQLTRTINEARQIFISLWVLIFKNKLHHHLVIQTKGSFWRKWWVNGCDGVFHTGNKLLF